VADPKEQLRKTLSDQFHTVECGCPSKVHTEDAWEYYTQFADAVLALGTVAPIRRGDLWVDIFMIGLPGGSSEGTEPDE
jgi:hypothetical protein